MKLRGLFELPVGYQDHSAGGSEAGFWLPAAAVGMGVDRFITNNKRDFGAQIEEIDITFPDALPDPSAQAADEEQARADEPTREEEPPTSHPAG